MRHEIEGVGDRRQQDVATTLSELAAIANRENELAEQSFETGLEHARQAGEALLAAKAQLQHGAWLPWLKANTAFSVRRAQEFMRLAQGWEQLMANARSSAYLSCHEALKALTKEPAEATSKTNGVHPPPESKPSPSKPAPKEEPPKAESVTTQPPKIVRLTEEVMQAGAPELIEAVERGKVSLKDAAKLADLPADQQREVVEAVYEGARLKEVVSIVAAAGEEVEKDALGIPLTTPEGLAAFETASLFDKALSLHRQLEHVLSEIAKRPGGELLRRESGMHREETAGREVFRFRQLHHLAKTVRWAKPYCSVCPYCLAQGSGHNRPDCKACKGLPYVSERLINSDGLPADYRQAVLDLVPQDARE